MKVRLIDISPLKESRKFRHLWVSGFFVNISFQVLQTALIWRVFQDTGSSLSVGLLGICIGLPTAVISLFGGALTDLKSPRTIGCLGVSGQIFALLVFLLLQSYDEYRLFSVYIYLILNSSFAAITSPTRRPYINFLLKRSSIPAASSLYALSMHSGQILGPIIGGALILSQHGNTIIYGLHISFLITYLVSVASLPPIEAKQKEGIIRSVVKGLDYSFKDPIIRFSLIIDLSITAMALPIALIPEFVSTVLNGDSYIYGLLMSSISVGGVFATIFSGTITRTKNIGKIFVVSSVIWCLSIIVFSQASTFQHTVVCLFIMGSFDVIVLILQQTIIQLSTSDKMLGRVGGLQLLVGMGGPQLGNARAGIMGKYLGVEMATLIGAPIALILIFSDLKGLKATWNYCLREDAVADI